MQHHRVLITNPVQGWSFKQLTDIYQAAVEGIAGKIEAYFKTEGP